MTQQEMTFQAEVSKLLDIVANALYSHKEIFLRELVSNAADACDRLRYAALTQADLMASDPELGLRLQVDPAARTLTIADNGIGMNRDDLVENLGTIARSGTLNFMNQLTGDARKDVSLIGQFGVGFYSAFMVADHVDVYTRRAGESHGWHWASDGRSGFTVGESDDAPARGSRVVLHLKEGEDEFLEAHRLRHIIRTYSDHIPLPIHLEIPAQGDDTPAVDEQANTGSALWTRPKAEVTADQYKEFYHHVAHAFDEPWQTLHYRAEGQIEYSALLFIPSQKPFDLFQPERKPHVKLYVRRVFITDDTAELVPAWLRFLRGVVDSEDLPLNISREMLQHNPVLAKIRSGVTRKVLQELSRQAENDPEGYATFWENFGAVLKEGLYEDPTRRDEILPLCRFRTNRSEGAFISLEEYIGRMRPGQEHIYFITGEDANTLAHSPQLEGFNARDVEVLLLTDAVDEFWAPLAQPWQDKAFQSATQGSVDLSAIETPAGKDDNAPEHEDAAPEESLNSLIARFKSALDGQVKDVRPSARLTESAACLVAEDGGVSLHLERLMRQNQPGLPETPRVLEINPRHPLVRALAQAAGAETAPVDDAARLLYDQARIQEGETVADPVAFGRRLTEVMRRAFPAA